MVRGRGEARVGEADHPANASRNGGLDLLRAVAAALVFATHLYWNFGQPWLGPIAAGGFVGVFLFFPLSGYLLYRPFVEGRGELRRYVISRVARIVPAYYLIIAVLWAVTPGPVPWAEMAFALNMVPATLNLNVAWTLGVEVAFYAILPVLALARRGVTIALLGGLSLFVSSQATDAWWMHQFPLMFWSFAAGMLVARYQDRLAWTVRLWPLGVALVAFGVWQNATGQPGHWAATGGTALLIAACAHARPSLPWARWPANISYGVFLWHPAVTAPLYAAGLSGPLLIVVAVVITVAIATGSWLLLERPVLRWSARIGRRDDERARAVGARAAAPGAAVAP